MRVSHIVRSLPDLPPRDTWRKLFPAGTFQTINMHKVISSTKTSRPNVADEDLADELVSSFNIKPGSVVVEAFPGLGYITRALLRRPKSEIRHVYAVEPSHKFCQNALGFPAESGIGPDGKTLNRYSTGAVLKFAESTAEAEARIEFEKKNHIRSNDITLTSQRQMSTRLYDSQDDDRLSVVESSLYDWATLTSMEALGCFNDVEAKAWSDETPNLHIIATMPAAVLGEQLTNQWIATMASQSWLFRYGRARMSLILPQAAYYRLMAEPGQTNYGKLAVQMHALADVTPSSPNYPLSKAQLFAKSKSKSKPKAASSSEPAVTTIKPCPWEDELIRSCDTEMYYPIKGKLLEEAPPLMAMTLEPKKVSPMNADNKDVWDYVMRRMFVTKAGTLQTAIKNLGAGAEVLAQRLMEPELPSNKRIDPKKKITQFSIQDWANVVDAFDNWKFKPDILHINEIQTDSDHISRMMGSGM